MAQAILKASAIITVDGNGTRAEAVAFDVERGTVLCAGSLADCRAAAPDAEIEDLDRARSSRDSSMRTRTRYSAAS